MIAHYVRTECKRRLRLDLSPDNATFRAERASEDMPEPQQPRPGLQLLREAGDEWEAAKLDELHRLLGSQALIGTAVPKPDGTTEFRNVALETVIGSATADRFIVRPRFHVGAAFTNALGLDDLTADHGLGYGELIPDLIQVLAPDERTDVFGVAPNGDTFPLQSSDKRLHLRLIDIKLTAEPNPGYFAEIVFYAMALAGWLIDAGRHDRFVVTSDASIWPGAHGASQMAQHVHDMAQAGAVVSAAGLLTALNEDLEQAPFEVFAFRLRRVLRDDLRTVLTTPWRELDWHVDNRCSGCDYLGYPWISNGQPTSRPNHCMPEAETQGQLSRVAFITRGSRTVLWNQGIRDISTLAALGSEAGEFDSHQTLRASRTVLPERAGSLLTEIALIPPDTGASGVMPKWADLRIYLTCDFDVGSGISFAFGIKAFWLEKREFGNRSATPRQTQAWPATTFVVPERSPEAERRQFLAFLEHLRSILSDPQIEANEPDLQVYIWDKLTYKHLCRVVGRHLDAVLSQLTLAHLAWLFPSEELIANARNETSSSPITIVQDVAKAVLAAPVPHYYNLFRVARSYHEATLPSGVAAFSVHPLFEDEFSDHIPSERAHEIWTQSTSPRSYWVRQLARLEETVGKRLSALETVTRRLEADLQPLLGKNAAAYPIEPPRREGGISVDGELWLAFHRLNTALDQLETAQVRAMPPHEREARHRSARLERRLTGREEADALARLGLQPVVGRRVYRMRPSSREARVRVGDFNFALAPESDPTFLESSFFAVAQRAGIPTQGYEGRWRMHDATSVSIAGLDRSAALIVIDAGAYRRPTLLDDLEQAGAVDLSRDVTLDPRHVDFFTPKLVGALRGLGNPPTAASSPLVQRAIGGFRWARPPRQTAHCPAADFVWDAAATQLAHCARDVPLARRLLEAEGADLNPSQWIALERALSRRLHLIWGPPGTGKSQTLRATLRGAMLESLERRRPLRILLSAFTWNAIDNVLYELLDELAASRAAGHFATYRLRSPSALADLPPTHAHTDTLLEARNPSAKVLELRERLLDAVGVTLVASTADQISNLLKVNDENREELFDLLVIDEASQMDVAHAVVAFSSLAEGASVILAGDPRQLAPSHQAEAPVGLEHLVSSIYEFFSGHHGVEHTMLSTNYRSNAAIVNFSRMAGYEASLAPQSPNLAINIIGDFADSRPPTWPSSLLWTPGWAEILDPAKAVCCFVYPEGSASQWNPFEADAITALALLLNGHLANRPSGERDGAGNPLPGSRTLHDAESFWRRGLGIVTPHRAQQGLVVSRLSEVFLPLGHSEATIRNAVDTVERFQGQQRDAIIASFALGDPDSIRDEDEFLFSLNRFNVMASRARAKLIVLVSQEVVDHLATDVEVMHQSKLLKVFVESFCNAAVELELGHLVGSSLRTFSGLLKWRQ